VRQNDFFFVEADGSVLRSVELGSLTVFECVAVPDRFVNVIGPDGNFVFFGFGFEIHVAVNG
jgi:hypothetical protein